MKKKKRSKPYSKILKEFKKQRTIILNAVLQGLPVFLKNTGVELDVEQFREDIFTYSKNPNNKFHIRVKTKTSITVECLDNFISYDISLGRNRLGNNGNTEPITVSGSVLFTSLSINPFDTDAAKILYKRRNILD